jgi:hypothetical protein
MLESQRDAPEGHLWADDLARAANKDVNTIVWLCEREFIQGVKLDGHWAVRVVRTTTAQAGTAIVRDLKAGRDIAIGSVIGQYVTLDGKDRVKDARERVAQTPVRAKLDDARHLLYGVWLLLGGGIALYFFGLMFTWPVAAVLVIPAWIRARQAVEMAEDHGDKVLLGEARSIQTQAAVTGAILWGVIIIGMLVFGSNP